MKFAIALSCPAHSPSARRALAFAQAVVEQGHTVERVFFYQEAVYLALDTAVLPQDEQDQSKAWQHFVQTYQLDAVVCIAAALRRGVLDASEAQRYQKTTSNLAKGFVLSGLGQWHEAVQLADRAIWFGADQ